LPIQSLTPHHNLLFRKILETFFLVEEERSMRTRMFQDLLLAGAIRLLWALCPVRAGAAE